MLPVVRAPQMRASELSESCELRNSDVRLHHLAHKIRCLFRNLVFSTAFSTASPVVRWLANPLARKFASSLVGQLFAGSSVRWANKSALSIRRTRWSEL